MLFGSFSTANGDVAEGLPVSTVVTGGRPVVGEVLAPGLPGVADSVGAGFWS